MGEMMGTPYYHTDDTALQTIENYQLIQGYQSLYEALKCMESCYDDLDLEDKSAYDHYIRKLK